MGYSSPVPLLSLHCTPLSPVIEPEPEEEDEDEDDENCRPTILPWTPPTVLPVLFCCRGGVLGLPTAMAQCSEVYFFLGTRALKVAVLRLEAGLGLLLALAVLLPPLLLSLCVPRVLGCSSDTFPQSSRWAWPTVCDKMGSS